MCSHEFQFHVLFYSILFYLFIWLDIWVIRQEEKVVEQM